MNIELKSGERIITSSATNQPTVEEERATFKSLIREGLGYEALNEFENLFEGYEGEDWELIADEHLSSIRDINLELESFINDFDKVMSAEKVKRKDVEVLLKQIKALKKNWVESAM